ncbi:hypothetical protein M115_2357 [Bacteroides fragilis str. 3719 T6]|nr:hypothetical protein M085_2195 [Bacteroides fragilis str. 3986 N(B)19]EYA48067.1 hypothetical protein M115_2357 [Bacteroides fragilis str. 3719 T6]
MSEAVRKIRIPSDKWDETGVLGKVSHEAAEEKALSEYEAYLKIQDRNFLSDFDKWIENLRK